MSSWNQARVGCPFYLDDDGKTRIVCEGLVKCSRIALEYSRQKDFDIQMKTFCWDRYTNCEIYRVLIEKVEYCE